MIKKFFFATALSVLTLTAAHAHDGAEGVIKERMDLMKVIGKNTKIIAPMAMGAMDADFDTLAASAKAIADASKAAMSKFPEGSTSDLSEAKETIWQDKAKFDAIFTKLTADADAIAKLAADKNSSDMTAAFQAMTSNCKACHMQFRAKKN